jgi:hypothetical protein
MRIAGESPTYELVPITTPPPSPTHPKNGAGFSFAQALHGIGGAVDRGEALIGRVARGNVGGLDSAELIALQAGIYRYSEAVDLVAKLVDRASNAVKTVISPH